MKIRIVTPSRNILEDEAEEVYAIGPKGEFGVLPGHAHYVTPLAVGRLFYQKNGQKKTYVARGGYVEVFQETVYVLADKVEAAENIHLEKSEQRLHEVEQQLAEGPLEPDEFQRLIEERDLEQAKVSTAKP